MSSKRSRIARRGSPPRADDLKFIIGIGPTIESRLHGVSIFTFAQLAAMSPADLAAAVTGIVGLTAERISKQDWIGKARELAAKSTFPEPQWIEEPRKQSQNSPTIAMTERGAKLDELTTTALAEIEPSPPSMSKVVLAGIFRLSDMEIVLGDTNGRHGILSNGQLFCMHLMLDLTDVTISVEALLHYTAIIKGKRLDSRIRQILGQGYGTITLRDRVNIKVDCTAPSAGAYHLEAAVTLARQTSEFNDLSALMKGSLLLVH